MLCGQFFKNRHAIIPDLARFNLAWHETSALLSCRGAKNLLIGQQLSWALREVQDAELCYGATLYANLGGEETAR